MEEEYNKRVSCLVCDIGMKTSEMEGDMQQIYSHEVVNVNEALCP